MLCRFIRDNISVNKFTKSLIGLFLFVLALLPFYVLADELQTYYIQKINEPDSKITVKDVSGRFYVLTYGPECSGWWRYVGQRIYINARAQFLDSVDDYIYLGVGSSRGCRVVKVSSVTGGEGYYSIYTKSICPDRGYISPTDSNMCECTSGYKYDIDRNLCVPFKSNDQICREKFGIYSIWDGTLDAKKALSCKCKVGFTWNQNQTACVKDPNFSTVVEPVANTGTPTSETQGATLGDNTANTQNTENTINNDTQNNTQRGPWYKTFWGLVIILVVVMLVVSSLVKYFKKKQ